MSAFPELVYAQLPGSGQFVMWSRVHSSAPSSRTRNELNMARLVWNFAACSNDTVTPV